MLKKALFVLTLATVFSAVAVSAKQLTLAPRAGVACGSPCTQGTFCARPCGCFIYPEGATTGTCQPEGPAPFRQPASTNPGRTSL